MKKKLDKKELTALIAAEVNTTKTNLIGKFIGIDNNSTIYRIEDINKLVVETGKLEVHCITNGFVFRQGQIILVKSSKTEKVFNLWDNEVKLLTFLQVLRIVRKRLARLSKEGKNISCAVYETPIYNATFVGNITAGLPICQPKETKEMSLHDLQFEASHMLTSTKKI